MKKHKILCLITLVCYLLFTVLGAVATVSLYIASQAPTPEGGSASDDLSYGIARAAAAVVMVIALGYTLLSLIPLALKCAHLFLAKTFLGILCLLTDAVYLCLHGALLFGALSSGDPLTLGSGVLCTVLLLASIAAAVTNILTLKNQSKITNTHDIKET